jgi:hypothetical protein
MKWLISSFLIIILLAPSVSKTLVIQWWVDNREEIAEELCINRFDASVMCGGHCVLEKEISKLDQNSQQNGHNVLDSILKSGTDNYTGSQFTADLHEPVSVFSEINNNFSAINFMIESHTPTLIIPPSC